MSREEPFDRFEGVLAHNLIRLTDCLNEGNLWGAFLALKVLVGLLKPEDRKPLLENEVAHIDTEINKAMKITRFDLYWTRRTQNSAVARTLKQNLYNAYLKISNILHEKGYFERERRRVNRSDFDKLENKSVEDEMDSGKP